MTRVCAPKLQRASTLFRNEAAHLCTECAHTGCEDQSPPVHAGASLPKEAANWDGLRRCRRRQFDGDLTDRLHRWWSYRRVSEPTLGASAPTMFSSLNGSSTATYGSFATPVAAIRLTVNARSNVGAKVTATLLQVGIGWMPAQPLCPLAATSWRRWRGYWCSLGAIFGNQRPHWRGPLCPRERTSSARLLKSEKCTTAEVRSRAAGRRIDRDV